jgi:hypothetical protein
LVFLLFLCIGNAAILWSPFFSGFPKAAATLLPSSKHGFQFQVPQFGFGEIEWEGWDCYRYFHIKITVGFNRLGLGLGYIVCMLM